MRLALLVAVLAAPALALVGPRGAGVGAPRSGVVTRGQGFGGEPAPKAKKKGKKAAPAQPTITVEDDAVAPRAKAPAPGGADAQDSIFEKFGIDSTGTRPSTVIEKPGDAPFEPLKSVPASAQIGFERLVIGGMGVCLLAFLGIGGAITYEAFAASSNQPLDPDVQKYITDVLEPKFTPSLLAGFSCSILLGGLKTLQLTSDTGQRGARRPFLSEIPSSRARDPRPPQVHRGRRLRRDVHRGRLGGRAQSAHVCVPSSPPLC